jgi:hypothetical protein
MFIFNPGYFRYILFEGSALEALLTTPYRSVIIVLSTFLQLSNLKPTQVCSAPAARQVISTTLAVPKKEL